MLRIPNNLEDWRKLHEEVSREKSPYQRVLLGRIFGDAYLIGALELFLRAEDPMAPEVLEPIEKFLMTVDSRAVTNYLVEFCFQNDIGDKLSVACFLLVSLSDKRLWPELPRFAESQDIRLQRCGAAILQHLVHDGLPSRNEASDMTDRFREIQDSHIQDLVARTDQELLLYPSEPNENQAAARQ